MDIVTLLVDSQYRTTGTITNFTMSFDLGLAFVPEVIRVIQIVLTPQSIPPKNVIYLCSNIIGGYSNGYYDIGFNLQNVIGGYCPIAVIPVTSTNTVVYNALSSQPFFTCLGTIFGKKTLTTQNPANLTFLLVNSDGTPANVTTDWICTIECKQFNNSEWSLP